MGRYDLRGGDVVDGHSVLARQPSDTAPEGETANTSGRIDANGRREAEFLGFMVEIAERRAWAGGRGFGAGVDGDRSHKRKIDHQAVVADRVARNVVSGASD